MLVAEHQGVGLELQPLGLLAALPGDRVGAEQPGVLDDLGARAAPWSTEYTSPTLTGRPNGQPVPSGPPVIGWKYS